MIRVENAIDGALLLGSILEPLGVRYFLTGSLASIYYGEVRATADADVVIEASPALAPLLSERLRAAFLGNDAGIQAAIRSRGSFQLLHVPSYVKIDVFVRAHAGYDGVQFDRSREVVYRGPSERTFVCSAEDIVLQKLRWFASTDGTSGLQWRDVRAVLKAMRGRLDLVFLRDWGDRLGVRAELERALIEAGYEEPDAESRA